MLLCPIEDDAIAADMELAKLEQELDELWPLGSNLGSNDLSLQVELDVSGSV